MNCHEVEMLLLAFLGSELTPEDKRELEEHLCACNHCRRELKSLKSFEVVFSRVEMFEAPARVNEQLLAVAKAPAPLVASAPFRRRTSWLRYASIGAAASVMISVSVWWNWPEQKQTTNNPPNTNIVVGNPTPPTPATVAGTTPTLTVKPPIDYSDMIDVRDLQAMLNKTIGAPRVSPLNNTGLMPVSSKPIPVGRGSSR